MDDEKIKEAFQKVKQDMSSLNSDLISIKNELLELKNSLNELKVDSTQIEKFKTSSTHSSTHNDVFKPLNTQNTPISIGNEGVPTDRQTDRQTDRHIELDTINEAAEILNTLDNVKKEIRLKFKRLTDQEITIFSTIYHLDEEFGFSDYKTLAQKLALTESSIRDYVGRLIKKGIPIEKNKVNNKNIQLSISSNLKKIAPLSTILQLRDL